MGKTAKFFGFTSLVLAGLLTASVYTGGFAPWGAKLFNQSIPLDEAKIKVADYVVANFNLAREDLSIAEITEEGGLYKLAINVQGQTVDSYLTPDGKLFFPQAYVMMDAEVAGAETEAADAVVQDFPKSETPEVLLFTMSFCPYGNIAEDAIKPAAEALGNTVAIEPHYVIYENYSSGYPDFCLDEGNNYCSMHGINEINQNVRESCVYELDQPKFWDFVYQVNSQCAVSNVETCWEGVAQELGLNTAAISDCASGRSEEFSQTDKDLNEKYNVSGSPALLINGVMYEGQRTPNDYKNAICSAFNNPPEACGETLGNSVQGAATGTCE